MEDQVFSFIAIFSAVIVIGFILTLKAYHRYKYLTKDPHFNKKKAIKESFQYAIKGVDQMKL